MTYCLIGLSQYGKTHLAKELIKKLQDETPKNMKSIVMVLVSFPDEWKKSEKGNSDKEIFIRPGNQLEVYDKSKGDYKSQLSKLCRHAFSDDIKNKYKIVFIDDQTTDINNREPLLTKLYSEGRHSYIQLIQCLHYLNAIHINNKAHIRDFILFGGQIYDKMKKFYIDLIGQHFDTNMELDDDGNEKRDSYDVDRFISEYNDFISGGLDPDDPDREKFFHNCFQISLPTKQSATAEMIKILPDQQYELVGTKNGIWKLLQKDLEKKKSSK